MNQRWRLEARLDEDVFDLYVTTAKGTGPKAYAHAVITTEGAQDRALLAHTIRKVRASAMRWRILLVSHGG